MNPEAISRDVQRTGFRAGKEQKQTMLPQWKVNRLLLCTDFSPASNAALHTVVRLWRVLQCKVTVLHVCEYGPMSATTEDGLAYINKLYAEQDKKLRGVVEELQTQGVVTEGLSLDGNAPTVILEQIDRTGADLVVMGTRATHGVERLIFGSTAEAVFRKACCPVMTIGMQNMGAIDSSAPVVFATDFREDHEECVKYAAGWRTGLERCSTACMCCRTRRRSTAITFWKKL